jgi:hypothetical protein
MGVTESFPAFLTCICPIGHKIRQKILWVVVGFVTFGADKSHTLFRSVNEISVRIDKMYFSVWKKSGISFCIVSFIYIYSYLLLL